MVKSPIKAIFLNLLALLLGLAFVIVPLAGVEVFQRCKHSGKPPDPIEDNLTEFLTKDPLLGRKLLADFTGIHYYRKEGRTIFSANYCLDKNGYRMTPWEDTGSRDIQALFFGCSFTFGLGVEQGETLPAAFAREYEAVVPFNFAVGGYGPQHMWLQIQDNSLVEAFQNAKGFAIYGLIDHHVERLMGEQHLALTWGRRLPWLDISEEGVKHRGFMMDRGATLVRWLQHFYTGCWLLNRFDLFPYTEEEGIEAIVMLFSDVQKQLKELMPGFELIVFSYPEEPRASLICSHLKQQNIICFDYNNRYEDDPEEASYFYDDGVGDNRGHPKAGVYADVAKWLARDLEGLCADQDQEVRD